MSKSGSDEFGVAVAVDIYRYRRRISYNAHRFRVIAEAMEDVLWCSENRNLEFPDYWVRAVESEHPHIYLDFDRLCKFAMYLGADISALVMPRPDE